MSGVVFLALSLPISQRDLGRITEPEIVTNSTKSYLVAIENRRTVKTTEKSNGFLLILFFANTSQLGNKTFAEVLMLIYDDLLHKSMQKSGIPNHYDKAGGFFLELFA